MQTRTRDQHTSWSVPRIPGAVQRCWTDLELERTAAAMFLSDDLSDAIVQDVLAECFCRMIVSLDFSRYRKIVVVVQALRVSFVFYSCWNFYCNLSSLHPPTRSRPSRHRLETDSRRSPGGLKGYDTDRDGSLHNRAPKKAADRELTFFKEITISSSIDSLAIAIRHVPEQSDICLTQDHDSSSLA